MLREQPSKKGRQKITIGSRSFFQTPHSFERHKKNYLFRVLLRPLEQVFQFVRVLCEEDIDCAHFPPFFHVFLFENSFFSSIRLRQQRIVYPSESWPTSCLCIEMGSLYTSGDAKDASDWSSGTWPALSSPETFASFSLGISLPLFVPLSATFLEGSLSRRERCCRSAAWSIDDPDWRGLKKRAICENTIKGPARPGFWFSFERKEF